MVKKCPNHAILIVHEDTHEIYKQRVQASLDGSSVVKKCQVPLWYETWQTLTDIDTCKNIRLIQAFIYHGYYNIISKGQSVTTIYNSLPS